MAKSFILPRKMSRNFYPIVAVRANCANFAQVPISRVQAYRATVCLNSCDAVENYGRRAPTIVQGWYLHSGCGSHRPIQRTGLVHVHPVYEPGNQMGELSNRRPVRHWHPCGQRQGFQCKGTAGVKYNHLGVTLSYTATHCKASPKGSRASSTGAAPYSSNISPGYTVCTPAVRSERNSSSSSRNAVSVLREPPIARR